MKFVKILTTATEIIKFNNIVCLLTSFSSIHFYISSHSIPSISLLSLYGNCKAEPLTFKNIKLLKYLF